MSEETLKAGCHRMHAYGATGAIRTATVVHGLRRRNQKYGMVTMCVGTGMGAAGVFESLR